jgi:uncharacterized membrane protein YgcG
MPAGRGEEERFAAGVEYGSIPGFLGAGDEDLARELELVALLRSAGPALSPTPAARNRAKERLMAAFEAQHATSDDTGPVAVIAPVAPVALASGRHAEPTRRSRHAMPEADAAEPADDAESLAEVRPLRRSRRERPGHRRAALLGAAAAAALVALAGTGTFASQDALPGDPLYNVKRVAESTGYALTFGEQAKARRHLEQAQRRLDEVEGMVTRDQAARATGAQVDPADQELVRSTMQEFDTNANEGSRLLLSDAADPAQVDDVREWATEQSARLTGLRSTMPAQDKADESLALLDRLLGEATAATQAACDPALGDCPVVGEGDPADSAGRTGSAVPESVVPGTSDPRTTARGGDDDPSGDAGDDTSGDDERPGGSSDDGSSDDGDRSGGSGSGGSGSGGGDAAGSGGGDVSVPLPLPAPVRVPSVGGLPGVSLGG